jgi:hypothetical protein
LWRLRHNTAGADIVAADQAKPIQALFIGQADARFERLLWHRAVHGNPENGVLLRPMTTALDNALLTMPTLSSPRRSLGGSADGDVS